MAHYGRLSRAVPGPPRFLGVCPASGGSASGARRGWAGAGPGLGRAGPPPCSPALAPTASVSTGPTAARREDGAGGGRRRGVCRRLPRGGWPDPLRRGTGRGRAAGTRGTVAVRDHAGRRRRDLCGGRGEGVRSHSCRPAWARRCCRLPRGNRWLRSLLPADAAWPPLGF